MSILGTIQAAQRSANLANLRRYQQGMTLYDQMIAGWKKGGGFVRGAEATLARTKKKDVASGMMSLSQSGLAGTTLSAGLPKRWEEEVGTPARLGIADIAGQRLMQAQQAKAGFIERREDVGPDVGAIMSAMQGMGQASGSGSTWGQYKPHPTATKMIMQQPTSTGTAYGRSSASRSSYVPYTPYKQTAVDIRGAAARKAVGKDPYGGSRLTWG